MARPAKTTTKKKPVAKKATTKKATVKKPVAKKTTAKAKAATAKKTSTARASTQRITLAKATGKPAVRRPPNNPTIPIRVLDSINTDLNRVKDDLDEYAPHLRALDRKRLNGVGVTRLGFIEAAYELALENPEYLPHFVSLDKWTQDHELFLFIRALRILCGQVFEVLKNMEITTADIDYTNASEFYYPVKEAAKRRVDGSETLHKILETHFKRKKSSAKGADAPETEKEFLRDAKAVYRGKKDGIVKAENISPKRTGGVRKVIDETFKNTKKFKETDEGEITE
jgi:hypothetical protein